MIGEVVAVSRAFLSEFRHAAHCVAVQAERNHSKFILPADLAGLRSHPANFAPFPGGNGAKVAVLVAVTASRRSKLPYAHLRWAAAFFFSRGALREMAELV